MLVWIHGFSSHEDDVEACLKFTIQESDDISIHPFIELKALLVIIRSTSLCVPSLRMPSNDVHSVKESNFLNQQLP